MKGSWYRRIAAVAVTALAVTLALVVGSAFAGSGAAAGGDVIVAHLTPLSPPGDYKSGKQLSQVVDLWAKQTNAAGGVAGQRVKVKRYDTKGKPEIGASMATRALRQDKAQVLFAGWNSSVSLAVNTVAHRYKTIQMTTYSWSDTITSQNFPEVFRIGPYNGMTADAFAPYLKSKGYKNVVIVAENTDFGKGLADAIKAATKGVKITIEEFQFDATDLTPVLSKAAASKPDALIVSSAYTPAQYLGITQAREVGYTGPIITGWDYPTAPEYWGAAKEKGIGIVYPSFTPPKLVLTATGKAFRKALRAAYGRDPVVFEYNLYDSLEAWRRAAEAAGSTKSKDVIPHLEKSDFEGTLGQITFASELGTVHYHQWEGAEVFFKELTKLNQTDEKAKVVFVAK